jgi:hypothetical protein
VVCMRKNKLGENFDLFRLKNNITSLKQLRNCLVESMEVVVRDAYIEGKKHGFRSNFI